MMKRCFPFVAGIVTLIGGGNSGSGQDTGERVEFTRMFAHWSEYGDPGYLDFIDAAQPDLVQLGFYGGHFWSLAHTPQYKGYPAHFPVQGLAECGSWFEEKNAALHQRGVKVIGHFNVEFLVGEPDGPEGPRGFFQFYRDLWDEAELGPKPVADPVELLEKDAAGKPLVTESYKIGGMREYTACLRNPAWQQVLKAWVKRGIERGVDGFIANYFYRHNCLCEHCRGGFRDYLAAEFTPEQRKERFGIADLESHVFDEIVCWHKPDESTPLRREMLRWSQLSNKAVFDAVFIDYGKSLKPGLIVGQWNHLSNFSAISGDERCFLPGETWGKGEDYLWYSTGASAHYSDLAAGFLGDATLQARYVRGAFDDKPFTLGKYESVRLRMAIGEMAANGGAPMGFYAKFTEPVARERLVQYYQFLRRNDGLYRANRPHAEVVLLFPRKAIHRGDLGPLEAFRQVGKRLLNDHVLFDVLPDDIATGERLGAYRAVIRPGEGEPPIPASVAPMLSAFEAPETIRISMSRPAAGGELTVHFVNYNREEPPRKKDGSASPGRGAADEKPIEAPEIASSIVLPEGVTIRAVEALVPEQAEAESLPFEQAGGRVTFTMPPFLVYGVARLLFQ